MIPFHRMFRPAHCCHWRANLAVEAAISVSNSNCSFSPLKASVCYSKECFSFKAAAHAMSAAFSASALMSAEDVYDWLLLELL